MMMQEAPAKLDKFKRSHPKCCFCGGNADTQTREHIPSRQFFCGRRRPDELVVSACGVCNKSTATSEQIVAALARVMRERTPRGLDEDQMDQIFFEGLVVNSPEVSREWATPPTARQTRRFRSLREQYGPVHFLNFGAITRAHVRAFAAKLACALHYNQIGTILPLDGGITVSMLSLDRLAREGPVDACFMELLGPLTTLRQGRNDVADQFVWRSAHDEVGSVNWVNLPGFMELVLVVANDLSIFPEVDRTGARVFRPGQFTADRLDVVGVMRFSWEQDFE